MVSPDVQAIIDLARREQQTNGGSESTESEGGSLPPDHSPLTGFQAQTANVFQQGSQRLPPLPPTFEHTRAGGGAPIAHVHRLSSDEQALERLPSITSTGVLVERDRLAAMQPHGASMSPTRDEPMTEADVESGQYQEQR